MGSSTDENFVIVDVDCGGDDAWALLMLIRAEEEYRPFDILGITCVSGNTTLDNVVVNTVRTLDSVDRTDIPVFKGCAKSTLPKQWEPKKFFHGKDGFGDLKHDQPVDLSLVQKTHAVTAMYEFVCKYPKKISFLCLGPLTNLAMCINLYDDFIDKVKAIYVMGGSTTGLGNYTASAEFNFYWDPEAAQIVLDNVKEPITLLPLEACRNGTVGITMEWRLETLGAIPSKSMQLMKRVDEVSRKKTDLWVEYDAMLAACFLFPTRMIIKEQLYRADVELHGPRTRGQVVLDRTRTDCNARIILELHTQNWKKIIMWTAKCPDDRKLEWM